MTVAVNRPALEELSGALWAMTPIGLDALHRAALTAADRRLAPAGPLRAAPPLRARRAGAVAVLSLYGVLTQYGGGPLRGTSTEEFAALFRQAVNDPGVVAVLLEVDSPGGSAYGVQELADLVHQSRSRKTIAAVVNSQAGSGAYWVAAQASTVAITLSGELGSIGVLTAHQDVSSALAMAGVKVSLLSAGRRKTEGNPYEPLTAEARQGIQERLDTVYSAFTAAVARGRGLSAATVRRGPGGRMLGAQAAVTAGLADRVATLQQEIERLNRPAPARPAASTATTARSRLDNLTLARESGAGWGRLYGGDPWGMARSERALMRLVSYADLLRLRREPTPPNSRLLGFCRLAVGGEGFEIYIDASLPAAEMDRVLAHELAHARWWGSDPSEDYCEEFAAAFVRERRAPIYGRRW